MKWGAESNGKFAMEDLPLGRIAALVPEFAVKDLPLGRTLMMIHYKYSSSSKMLGNELNG